jgi:hypothetical protein
MQLESYISETPVAQLIAAHSAKELRAMYAELGASPDNFPKSVRKQIVAEALKSLVRARHYGKAFKAL